MSTVISVERVSKAYRLGTIGGRTLRADVSRWWAKFRGKPDPLLKIGQEHHAGNIGEQFWALNDVCFEVQEGEVLGIIGRNGAGKSTLLKILSQVTAPTSGEIKIRGRIASLLEVGTGFHPELTGRENIFLNGAILGMTREEIRKKLDEIIDFSGIEEFIDTPVKRYSSGMYVRLAFAVAAHLEPEILIVDEVLAVGDASFQKKCIGKMSEVSRQGRTVLFVSHNLASIEKLCQRGLVLNRGEVTFKGSQKDAIARYVQGSMQGEQLGDRNDREGAGEVRIERISLRDSQGEEIEFVTSGQDVDVCFRFRKYSSARLRDLNVSLLVTTPTGSEVFLLHNRLTGDSLGEIPDSGTFVCRIERLPLPPATYQINYSILTDLGRGHFCDRLEGAAPLTVIDGNYFGTGEVPSISHGVCLVPGRWWLEGIPN